MILNLIYLKRNESSVGKPSEILSLKAINSIKIKLNGKKYNFL